jgi:hypothetical protein
MIMISSFAAAKQFNLSIRVNRNYDLFSRWEQEGWTPPSMKRPSLPARVVDAKKSMNFPSLLKSTGCESELELKELLMRKPLPRGKGLKSIKFFKVWIGPNAFYRLISDSAWKSRHKGLSSPESAFFYINRGRAVHLNERN